MADKKLTPREAKTYHQICALDRDNLSTRKGWIIVDVGKVTLVNQRPGHELSGEVTFTRAQFERLIDWYNTGAPKPAKKAKAKR